MSKYAFGLCCALAWAGVADAQRLFVGLEGSAPVTRSTDLAGFPDVVYENHFAFDVSGAAAAPDGTLYLCNGAFNTKLYESAASSTDTPITPIRKGSTRLTPPPARARSS